MEPLLEGAGRETEGAREAGLDGADRLLAGAAGCVIRGASTRGAAAGGGDTLVLREGTEERAAGMEDPVEGAAGLVAGERVVLAGRLGAMG